LAWAAVAVLLYLAAVTWMSPVSIPGVLLFDGYTPPPPYHWVHAPAALARGNQVPEPGSGVIAFTPSGSAPASIATGDEQAVVVFPKGSVAPRPGEPSVEVRLEPLDPATVAPPPEGQRYDGNAYRVTATYTLSHAPAPLLAPINVVLRYAIGANAILRRAGDTWAALSPTTLPITFQVYGPTNDLGTFVATTPPPHGVPLSVWAYRIVTILLWLGAAFIAGVLVRDYTRRRRRGSGAGRPQA